MHIARPTAPGAIRGRQPVRGSIPATAIESTRRAILERAGKRLSPEQFREFHDLLADTDREIKEDPRFKAVEGHLGNYIDALTLTT